MADNRETKEPTLETVGLTTKSLLQLVGIVVAVAATYYSLDQWVDNRTAAIVESYDARFISPKIAANTYAINTNAKAIEELRIANRELKEMMQTQDYARNRQYGELKSLLADNKEDTKKIINHLLVNK